MFYRVACTFEVSSELVVEADSEEEAQAKAYKAFDPAGYDAEMYFTPEEIDPADLDEDELEEVIRK